MDAVPTRYGDTTFPSQLEADWAATLDVKGIRWEYEPKTIALESGTLYLPGFWLPGLGTWIEAKGPGIPRTEKTEELGNCSGAETPPQARKAIHREIRRSVRRALCAQMPETAPSALRANAAPVTVAPPSRTTRLGCR